MKIRLSVLLVFVITNYAMGQNTYYVSSSGNDTNSGLTELDAFATITYGASIANHGDTVLVLPGIYQNSTYATGLDIWKNERTVDINNKTTSTGDYLVIKPKNPNSVLLKGDGSFIIQIRNSNNIRVEGFEIEGELDNIPLSLAEQYQFTYKDSSGDIQERVPPGLTDAQIAALTLPVLNGITRPTYFNTSGISVNSSHHIEVINNTVYDMPGEGIRSFTSDFLTIVGNKVYNCSRRSSTGVHGLSVYTLDSNIDTVNSTFAGQRVLIAKNEVHDNFNEIYSWSSTKTFINPHIDEGKGITVQRCTEDYSWLNGIIRIENNIAYRNGFSGIQVNSGTRVEILNNTCYENNVSGEGDQHGISVQDGNDILISNNIIQTDPNINNGKALKLSANSGTEGFITITDNIILGNLNATADSYDLNTINVSPLFVDETMNDFSLQSGSPAINSANVIYAVSDDFFSNNRGANPDIGAIEYMPTLGTESHNTPLISSYPNPVQDILEIKGHTFTKSEIRIFNSLGQEFQNFDLIGNRSIDLSNLPSGLYIVKIKTFANKVYKQ